MKLLINVVPLRSGKTGVGVYILSVAGGIKERVEETTFFSGRFTKSLDVKEVGKLKTFLKRVPIFWNVVKSLSYKYLSRSDESYDVYFEPNFIPLLNVKSRRVVTTVHDFSFLRREWLPRDRYDFFKENFPKYLGRSDFFIVPSSFVKGELQENFGVDEGRIKVINHGIDTSTFFPTQTEKEQFLLFVGSLQPRKNLKRLIGAYRKLPEYIKKEFKLLIVGMERWGKVELSNLTKGKNVDVLSNVKNSLELANLYRKAFLFVFPSLYEGFGFPPLEAMACGCPTVVSNTSSLPEVCGNASLFVDPYDEDSIAQGIQRAIEDIQLRQELITKGLERVKDFSWERSVDEHLNLFESLL